MHINPINNINFKGTMWMEGKFVNQEELSDIANPYHYNWDIHERHGIHFNSEDVRSLWAINERLSVISLLHSTDEGTERQVAVVPYNLEFILNAYNASKGPVDVDVRRIYKESYYQ